MSKDTERTAGRIRLCVFYEIDWERTTHEHFNHRRRRIYRFHLVDALIGDGHDVTVVDNLSTGNRSFINPRAHFFEADIRSGDLVSIFKEGHFDAVYHEAAQTMVPVSIKDPYEDADQNIMGLLSVLEAARATGVKKIIFLLLSGDLRRQSVAAA